MGGPALRMFLIKKVAASGALAGLSAALLEVRGLRTGGRVDGNPASHSGGLAVLWRVIEMRSARQLLAPSLISFEVSVCARAR